MRRPILHPDATDGKGEILVFNGYGLVPLSDGRVLKKYQHKTRFGITALNPLTWVPAFSFPPMAKVRLW